ncbi:type I phosphomannose isomerase catalytic subunit [Christiangramia sp. SM2212]|uniref:Phosphohexomutase n=1 Tax=Christiangramia sediminicola TaxID=3073267 RepID=A0ABU1EL15_9FLAO|nr:type I phosphomannose isomerase catalytic subunit [Christiangramia sp. SM2212]MDR5589056.1 mannose-6-phosphate isomerase [Christiangramia sp. SM2212]
MISEKFESYGIKFQPILKDKIWGGSKLKTILGKPASPNAGESWEISTVNGEISVIENGPYSGVKFDDLIAKFQSEILGKMVVEKFGGKFPLLFKYIDAAQNLSVQVHPGDEMAKKFHNSYGKTEMWYIIQADEKAEINVGWKNEITPEQYEEVLQNGTIAEHLNFIKVSEGDSFFIKAGKVHAIGAGVLLAEIQQTSDVTYRVYDWDRVDDKGNGRELHIDKARDAMNFKVLDDHSVKYKSKINESSKLVDCEYFTTNFIAVQGSMQKDYSSMDSFVVYMCVKGEVKISVDGADENLEYGQTILIPAAAKVVELKSESADILEVSISGN